MALIWDYTHLQLRRAGDQRASRSPLVQNDVRRCSGVGYLRHFQFTFSNPWLTATVIDRRMPIQNREHWADSKFVQVDEKRDAWLSIPLVFFFDTMDVLSFNRHCRKRCAAGIGQFFSPYFLWSSSTGATVHARAKATPLEQLCCEIPQRREPRARPEAGEGIEVVRACACDPRRQSRSHGSHGFECHQLETSCDLRRWLREEVGLEDFAFPSEEFVRQVRDEWREAQANPARLCTICC